jgi:hypothetical protein
VAGERPQRSLAAGALALRVVDRSSGQALQDVVVHRIADGERLGATGAEGRITLHGVELGQLVFARDGWLLFGFAPAGEELQQARSAQARGEEVLVALLEDRCTIPLRLRFVDGSGRPVRNVRFSLGVLAEAGSVMDQATDPTWARLWELHLAHARSGRFLRAHYVTGSDRLHEAEGETELRIARPGRCRIGAFSGTALALDEVDVRAPGPHEQTIRLHPVPRISGRLLAGDDARPIAGALVRVRPHGPWPGDARTDEAGCFLVPSCADEPLVLTIVADGFAPATLGPLHPGQALGDIALARLRAEARRGLLEEVLGGRPVAGAR